MTHLRFLIYLCCNFDFQYFFPAWVPSPKPKIILIKKHTNRKKRVSYSWKEADKQSQTWRSNLIKFNRAEQIAQALNNDSSFLFFLLFNLCLLKHFYTPVLFLHLLLLREEQLFTERDNHSGFIWILTKDDHHLCKLILWLYGSHKYQPELHFTENSHILLFRLCCLLLLFKLLSWQKQHYIIFSRFLSIISHPYCDIRCFCCPYFLS